MDLAILKLQKQLQTAKCKELKKPPNWRFFYVSILMSGTLCLVFSALYIEQGNQVTNLKDQLSSSGVKLKDSASLSGKGLLIKYPWA